MVDIDFLNTSKIEGMFYKFYSLVVKVALCPRVGGSSLQGENLKLIWLLTFLSLFFEIFFMGNKMLGHPTIKIFVINFIVSTCF